MKEARLKPVDQNLLASALTDVRKIRQAVLLSPHRLSTDNEVQAAQQKGFSDAEQIAKGAANLMLAYMEGASPNEERERLDMKLTSLHPFYEGFTGYTWSGVKPRASLEGYITDSYTLESAWENILIRGYKQNNNIPLEKADDLSDSLGIIAPLSTDYLRATLHREFILKHVQPNCFVLGTAAVQVPSDVIFPLTSEGRAIHHDRDRLGIYIDVMNEGNTAIAIHNAARKTYPGKVIYSAANRRF